MSTNLNSKSKERQNSKTVSLRLLWGQSQVRGRFCGMYMRCQLGEWLPPLPSPITPQQPSLPRAVSGFLLCDAELQAADEKVLLVLGAVGRFRVCEGGR